MISLRLADWNLVPDTLCLTLCMHKPCCSIDSSWHEMKKLLRVHSKQLIVILQQTGAVHHHHQQQLLQQLQTLSLLSSSVVKVHWLQCQVSASLCRHQMALRHYKLGWVWHSRWHQITWLAPLWQTVILTYVVLVISLVAQIINRGPDFLKKIKIFLRSSQVCRKYVFSQRVKNV